MKYPKIFEPGRIGSLELKNRIVMTAMGCSLAESNGQPGTRMIKYYADRARGGAGLIITEITRMDRFDKPGQLTDHMYIRHAQLIRDRKSVV